MELNQIPQNPNNWGNVADLLNENSGKIEAETAKLNNATTKFKGYFSTSTSLSAKWPSPLVGDTAQEDRSGCSNERERSAPRWNQPW